MTRSRQGTDLRDGFNAFDACFLLLAAEKIPSVLFPFIPPIAKGLRGRERVLKVMIEWIEEGMPGLNDGVIQEMTQILIKEGYSSREIATLLSGDLWALQANTPSAAAALLLYIFQSQLLPAVREEISRIPTKGDTTTPELDMQALASLDLVASCVQETLRLNTSSYSIRIVEKPFVLPVSEEGASTRGFLIPGGSHVVCITRAAHLSDALWGENPSIWDGERFLEKDEAPGMRSKKAREMRGFGGGISIVCNSFHFYPRCLPVMWSVQSFPLTNLVMIVRRQTPCVSRTQGFSCVDCFCIQYHPSFCHDVGRCQSPTQVLSRINGIEYRCQRYGWICNFSSARSRAGWWRCLPVWWFRCFCQDYQEDVR